MNKSIAQNGQTSRKVSNLHLQGENLRVSLRFNCQREQDDVYKLSTKDFGALSLTTRVEKVTTF